MDLTLKAPRNLAWAARSETQVRYKMGIYLGPIPTSLLPYLLRSALYPLRSIGNADEPIESIVRHLPRLHIGLI